MTIQSALLQATRLLDEAGIAVPRLTAEVLLCHALGQDRAYLFAHGTDELTRIPWIHFGRYLHERMQGKPTQYITKRQEFYGRDFRVEPGVLIPRPETEHLAERAIALARPGGRILDIGCGSGILAVTVALEAGCHAVAADVSSDALRIARGNAARWKAPVEFVQADLAGPFSSGAFDLIVSNPPYVAESVRESLAREVRDFEPAVALFAGPDGLAIFPRLIASAAPAIVPGGWLAVEIGADQELAVRGMFGPDWTLAPTGHDLAGHPRVLSARRNGPCASGLQ